MEWYWWLLIVLVLAIGAWWLLRRTTAPDMTAGDYRYEDAPPPAPVDMADVAAPAGTAEPEAEAEPMGAPTRSAWSESTATTAEGHDHEGHDHEGHDHEGHDREGHDHEGHDHEGHDEAHRHG